MGSFICMVIQQDCNYLKPLPITQFSTGPQLNHQTESRAIFPIVQRFKKVA